MVNKYYDLATSFYEYGEQQLANRTTATGQGQRQELGHSIVSCLPPGLHTAVTAAPPQAGAPPSTLRTG